MHQCAIARIGRERCRAFEFTARFIAAPQLFEQIAAHRVQQAVVAQLRGIAQGIDQRQCGQRPLRLSDCDRAIEFDDRRRLHPRQRRVQRGDPRPVGVPGAPRARMAVNAAWPGVSMKVIRPPSGEATW